MSKIEDMHYEEFKNKAIGAIAHKVITSGFSDLGVVIDNIVYEISINKVFGGKKNEPK